MRDRIARIGSVNGHRLWSKREDETLRKAYPNYTAARIALPHRTYVALQHRACCLGIQRRKHAWSSSDFAKLRQMYPVATQQKLLAAFPGLGWRAIELSANRRHLRKKVRPLHKTGDAL